MKLRNPIAMLALGILCSTVATIIGRFTGEFSAADFLQGVFSGMAVVFLPAATFFWRQQRS
ncbi:MAG: hypothetical protein GY867_12035 [bacterium]|nr:hypothetical protein [bacterium]